jgi:alkanesulfonate monooxygenase SsuD/methylene tetrahydromethanopterin reductase-like flavin-dependent oxidoreductase (luciferase family)
VLGVALEGAGWHPAAWRHAPVPAAEYFRLPYWAGQVRAADEAALDFVAFDDAGAPQSAVYNGVDDRVDRFRGRFDAVQLAAATAPLTRGVGLIATATVTHSEPFHLSTALATLDQVSGGRGGWQLRVTRSPVEAANVGLRSVPPTDPALGTPEARALADELFEEGADAAEVVRRLWDSWEDDAVIRDSATGRYLDGSKLHRVDFEGRWFSVRGPSVTPRPPQGQPVVAVLSHYVGADRLAARAADLVFVTPGDPEAAVARVAEVRGAEAEADRRGEPLRVLADVTVFLAESEREAGERRARWDDEAGPAAGDALVFTGTPAGLAELLAGWRATGLDGFRLRPASVHHDLPAVTRGLVPELRARGLFRTRYDSTTLRGHLGLGRPRNRYAAGRSAAAAL